MFADSGHQSISKYADVQCINTIKLNTSMRVIVSSCRCIKLAWKTKRYNYLFNSKFIFWRFVPDNRFSLLSRINRVLDFLVFKWAFPARLHFNPSFPTLKKRLAAHCLVLCPRTCCARAAGLPMHFDERNPIFRWVKAFPCLIRKEIENSRKHTLGILGRKAFRRKLLIASMVMGNPGEWSCNYTLSNSCNYSTIRNT